MINCLNWFKTDFIQTARQLGLDGIVREGVYTMVGGPNYETVAELKMLRELGELNCIIFWPMDALQIVKLTNRIQVRSPNSIFVPSAPIFRKLYVSFNEDITAL